MKKIIGLICVLIFTGNLNAGVGDLSSGKLLEFGISVGVISDIDFVCRYEASNGKVKIWTPYQELGTVAFFNGKTGAYRFRLYTFSKMGAFLYDPSAKEWSRKNKEEYIYGLWHPKGKVSEPIYGLTSKEIKVFTRVMSLKYSYHITDFGDTLTLYYFDLRDPDTLYVATEKGIYAGIGSGDKVWYKVGNNFDPIYSFIINGDSLIAGGPLGFYAWDGNYFVKISSNPVEKLWRVGDYGFVVSDGIFYRFLLSNIENWSQISELNVADLKQWIGDTLLVGVKGKGVYLYDISVNDFIDTLSLDGLKEYADIGALEINYVDFNPFDLSQIFVGNRWGGFYYKDNRWYFEAGVTDAPGFVGVDGLPDNLLGFNVSTVIVDSIAPLIDSIFVNDSLYDKVVIKYEEFFGIPYPDADNFDGLHIILFPLHLPSSDPSQGYYPDIKPVIGFFSEEFYNDPEMKLKECVTLDPLEYMGLPSYEIKKGYLDYFMWRIGIFGNKTHEHRFITTGFALAFSYNLSGFSFWKQGLIPDTLHSDYLPGWVTGFSFNPNLPLLMFSQTHTILEPNEPNKEKLFSFFNFIFQKFEDSWKQIITRKKYTYLDLLDFVFTEHNTSMDSVLLDWVQDNAKAPQMNHFQLVAEDKIALGGWAGYYLYINDTISHSVVFDVEDGKAFKITYFVMDKNRNIITSHALKLDSVTNTIVLSSDADTSTYEVFALTNLETGEVYITWGYGDTLPPLLETVVLQNPGVPNLIDLYTWGKEETPYADANKKGVIYRIYKIGENPALASRTPITEEFVSGIFTGSFTFGEKGEFVIEFISQDKIGNIGIGDADTISFFVLSSLSIPYELWNGEVTLYSEENSGNQFSLALAGKYDEQELNRIGILPLDLEDQGISKVYVIGSENIVLDEEILITVKNPTLRNKDLYLYRFNESSNRWEVLSPVVVDRERGKIVVKTNVLGKFQLRKGEGVFVKGNIPEFIIPTVMKGDSRIILFVPGKGLAQLKIYDVSGRVYYESSRPLKEGGVYYFDTGKLQKGVYFIKGFVDNKEIIKKKVLVVK